MISKKFLAILIGIAVLGFGSYIFWHINRQRTAEVKKVYKATSMDKRIKEAPEQVPAEESPNIKNGIELVKSLMTEEQKEKHINSRSPSIIHLCLTFILVGLIFFLLANFLIGCALSGIKCPSCGDPVSIGDAHYMQCSQGHGLYSCDHSAVDKHQHEESSKK